MSTTSSHIDINGIVSESLAPIQLIPKLAPFITGPDADLAFNAISKSILDHRDTVTDTLRQHLITFLQSVFQFRRHLSPGLASLIEALCELGTFPDLPIGISLLSCEPTCRRSLLNALRAALPADVQPSLLSSLLSLMEDETDPPALLAAFRLIAEALDRIKSELPQLEAESVFDHCSIYFPITYNGTSCDGDQLRSWLLQCLTSRLEMASFALPFFLDKLHSSMNQAQMQSLSALDRCMPWFPISDTISYLSEFSSCLIEIWAEPSSPSATIEISIRAFSSTLKSYYSSNASPDEMQICSERFVQPIISLISKRLQSSVPVRSSSAYVQALAALCSSSSYTFDLCYELIWPILMQRIISSKDPNEQTVAALIVRDTFVASLGSEKSVSDLSKSLAIIDTLLSVADPSSPSDLLRSVISSLSLCVHATFVDSSRLSKVMHISIQTIQQLSFERDSDTVQDAFKILEQICLRDVHSVVEATLSDFLIHPEHLQYLCVHSSAYLRAVLPSLRDRRSSSRTITETLCAIAKQCSDVNVADLVSEVGLSISGAEDADLLQAIYSRCSSDQQTKLSSKYMTRDYVNDPLTTVCILNRLPDTAISNEMEMLKVALDSARHGNHTACLIVADILNKCQSRQTIDDFLKLPSYYSIDWSSSDSSSLLIWITKALASRGDPIGFKLATDLVMYRCHLSQIYILIDDTLPLVSWYILPLYKQRLLCTLLPILLESDSYLDCLPQLLASAPRQVLIDYSHKLLPPLERSLRTSAAQYSLSSLIILTANEPSLISGQASTMIEPILALMRPEENTKTRLQALQMMSLIVQNFAAEDIYPYKNKIKSALTASLDDEKRLCRQEARRCLQLTEWQ